MYIVDTMYTILDSYKNSNSSSSASSSKATTASSWHGGHGADRSGLISGDPLDLQGKGRGKAFLQGRFFLCYYI